MDSFIQALEKYQDVLEEYYRLECRPTFNGTGVDRVQKILEQAQDDPVLDFLLGEVDHILGHELGLIDEKFIQQQQQKLKVKIDAEWMEYLMSHLNNPNLYSTLEEAQTRLKKEGFYNGRIDGVFGPVTKQAFRGFRRRIREQLERQGLPGDSIEGILQQDQAVLETVHQEGNEIDPQAVELLKELLSLEAKFL